MEMSERSLSKRQKSVYFVNLVEIEKSPKTWKYARAAIRRQWWYKRICNICKTFIRSLKLLLWSYYFYVTFIMVVELICGFSFLARTNPSDHENFYQTSWYHWMTAKSTMRKNPTGELYNPQGSCGIFKYRRK